MSHVFFTDADGHSGCFCVLVVVSSAAVHPGVHVSFRIMNFFIFGFSSQILDILCVWRSAIFQKKKKLEVQPAEPATLAVPAVGRSMLAVKMFSGNQNPGTLQGILPAWGRSMTVLGLGRNTVFWKFPAL